MLVFRTCSALFSIVQRGLACSLLVMLAPVAGVAEPLACVANSGVPPILNGASTAAEVGDTILSCTGGTPGTPIPVTFDAVLNVPVIVPGAWTLSDGINTYSGILRGGTNSDVEFQNVPFNPPGASGTEYFTIGNIFVDPSLYAGSPVSPGLFQFTEAISDSASIPILNSEVTVAYNIPVTAQVPEPTCLVLLSIGVGVIGVLRLKPRRG
jgi:hypothetical protein